jgi:hypothetical protein
VGLTAALAFVAGFGPCAPRADSGDAPPVALEATGIAECDSYANKYEACLEKLPPEQRDALLPGAASQRSVLRALAAKPDARAVAVAACAQALAGLGACP